MRVNETISCPDWSARVHQKARKVNKGRLLLWLQNVTVLLWLYPPNPIFLAYCNHALITECFCPLLQYITSRLFQSSPAPHGPGNAFLWFIGALCEVRAFPVSTWVLVILTPLFSAPCNLSARLPLFLLVSTLALLLFLLISFSCSLLLMHCLLANISTGWPSDLSLSTSHCSAVSFALTDFGLRWVPPVAPGFSSPTTFWIQITPFYCLIH